MTSPIVAAWRGYVHQIDGEIAYASMVETVGEWLGEEWEFAIPLAKLSGSVVPGTYVRGCCGLAGPAVFNIDDHGTWTREDLAMAEVAGRELFRRVFPPQVPQ